ncbi:MAG: aldose 1-epimerase family protein [Christensenellaceae bacterium]|nr:aldose 1-epimerase family protein [Christensenellaceae bacterium]
MAEIQLRYGESTALIDRKGAQIVSFKGHDGREVLWSGDPEVWGSHAPVLFPVCGSLRDDTVTIDGKPYPMTKHGFVRNAEFTIAKQGDDFVELILTPTEDMRRMYPFDFIFHVTYTLVEDGYTTTFLVENKSDRVMPFCVGGHPGFSLPMEEGASFSDYQIEFAEIEDGLLAQAPDGKLIVGYGHLPDFHNARILPLKRELFDHDALIFDGLKSRSVRLVHRISGKGLHFSFPKMEVLAVWTKPSDKAAYVCLEPWHGLPGKETESGRFEDKAYATMLDPGSCYKTWFTTALIR